MSLIKKRTYTCLHYYLFILKILTKLNDSSNCNNNCKKLIWLNIYIRKCCAIYISSSF